MNDDDISQGEPKGDAFVWSERDIAELWANIVNDSCIDPTNWQAAYRAALRGEPEWWLAVCEVDETMCDDENGGELDENNKR